jgi:hypothetical protein
MSLVFCPECSHEISTGAVACPNCGLPLRSNPAVVERSVVTRASGEGFPAWAWVPIGVVGLLILILFFFMLRGSDDTANMNVAVNARRANQISDTRTSSVPPTDGQTVSVPGSAPPTATEPGSVTTVPGTSTSQPSAPPPTKGAVTVNARIMPPRGAAPQPARSARFFLLDKDVESILSDAGIEPIEGNDLTASLGLAAVYPDRYGDFQRAAMRAIAASAKYSFTTDGSGKAEAANVEPSSYYLFGVQRVGRGFALWNSPVSVIPGTNVLNLSPQMVTEIGGATG